jgi:methyl-accepting chemotaxis protein
MNAITWPVAVLIFGVVAALGGLNSPLKAMAEAFGGIFKDLRAFRGELETLERKLAEMPDSFSKTVSGLQDYVKDLDSDIKTKLNEIEQQIQTVKERVTQEALAGETGIEPNEISSGTLGVTEAQQSITEISAAWAGVRESLAEKFPTTSDFDKREYGRAILELARNSPNSNPSIELAEAVASLHSRFKGFTRRKAYAQDWITAEIRESYLEDAAKAREQLALL